MENWAVRIKVLLLSAVFGSIANTIATWKAGAVVMPWEVIPGLALMFAIIIVGCILEELVTKYLKVSLPKILYISMISVILSIPGFSPIAEWMVTEFNKIGLIALCTPILAYAGIAIGKDLEAFKKQGFAIICVACLTFVGTYIGSAVIAQIVLKVTGAI